MESAVPPTHSRDWRNMTRTLAHYERTEQIGEGTYGQVYRAKCLDTGRVVAMKKIRVHHGGYWGMPPTVIREIKILKRLQHPNLVEMLEVVSSKGVEYLEEDDAPHEKQSNSSESQYDRIIDAREGYKGNIYLVLEYVSHDLTGLMDVAYRFTEVQIKCIFQQLLQALKYMHDQKYIHRDIKSSNILIDSHFRVKLADFGLARCIEPPILENIHDRGTTLDFTNKVITLWYRPPEILLGATRYGAPVDMWSAGCILAELILGRPLFTGKTEMEQLQLIFEVLGTPNDLSWEGFSDLKLIRTGEVMIENQRQSKLRDKYGHKLSLVALNLLEKLLELDPKKRLTASRALTSRYFLSDPVPPERPEDLGILQLGQGGGHFHEFQTKKKRREAKAVAKKASNDARAQGMSEKDAEAEFDAVYRDCMKKVAEEGNAGLITQEEMKAKEEKERKEREKKERKEMETIERERKEKEELDRHKIEAQDDSHRRMIDKTDEPKRGSEHRKEYSERRTDRPDRRERSDRKYHRDSDERDYRRSDKREQRKRSRSDADRDSFRGDNGHDGVVHSVANPEAVTGEEWGQPIATALMPVPENERPRSQGRNEASKRSPELHRSSQDMLRERNKSSKEEDSRRDRRSSRGDSRERRSSRGDSRERRHRKDSKRDRDSSHRRHRDKERHRSKSSRSHRDQRERYSPDRSGEAMERERFVPPQQQDMDYHPQGQDWNGPPPPMEGRDRLDGPPDGREGWNGPPRDGRGDRGRRNEPAWAPPPDGVGRDVRGDRGRRNEQWGPPDGGDRDWDRRGGPPDGGDRDWDKRRGPPDGGDRDWDRRGGPPDGGDRDWDKSGGPPDGGDRDWDRRGDPPDGGDRDWDKRGGPPDGGDRDWDRRGGPPNGGDRDWDWRGGPPGPGAGGWTPPRDNAPPPKWSPLDPGEHPPPREPRRQYSRPPPPGPPRLYQGRAPQDSMHGPPQARGPPPPGYRGGGDRDRPRDPYDLKGGPPPPRRDMDRNQPRH